MDVTSYLLGKSAGGGGSEPTGTITITENGTHNVKDYASADVNVSGGGSPSTLNEVRTIVNNFFGKVANNYETDTTENVTLYAPNENCKTYLIYKNSSSGKYRVAWFEEYPGVYIYNNQQLYYSTLGFTYQSLVNVNSIQLKPTTGSGSLYNSSDYSTIEECLQAIQSNTTTYTAKNSMYISPQTPYKIPYCNSFIYDDSVNDLIPSKRISSNETIQSIN